MDDLLSEKEQLEQIRTWWKEYGGYVIGGLGLGIAVLVGWNYYQGGKLESQLAGSALYETLAEHVESGSLDQAEAVADDLATNYTDTTYAAQGKLALARLYMDRNRDQDAVDVLQEITEQGSGGELELIARARLARILLYQGKAEEVVALLEDQESAAFAATFDDLLGDAYRDLGRYDDAQAAYERVMLDPVAQATVDQQFVQWKAQDLPPPESSEPAPGEVVAEDAVEEPVEEPVDEPVDEPAGENGT
ncbi:MAG: tetratricopeptide repeat protein [Gammaproteobacteria bacterium]|nr:tetratricopeptide repeat protein [Gammaproteobacteria bacterium]NNF50732.1 tetratricopeptide repeat protein [Woeseiaceae bacterium]MBT8094951.1 tetratricopeptide repeat protein [Gammaproteobacteria bacterium]MBT8105448.1 tetratricopeptide repeat protein [Gammaproteobacteria bacterium]NNK25462.1 tetratricopeptide repeat protein [Woeseiaceae bacterium]